MPSTPNTPILNVNPLTQFGFNVIIKRLPVTSFFAKAASLPGMSVNNVSLPTMYSPIPMPGDHPHWGSLTIEFIVDEDMKNWEELFKWMVGITFPESNEQWKALIGSTDFVFKPGNVNQVWSEITIQTLTSARNPNIEFTYHNCLPVTLSDITLNNSDSDIHPVTCTATFVFSHFDINRLRNN